MNNKKIAVFTIGIPASGKSTHINKYYKNFIILDCDKIKENLPNYNPKKPEIFHSLSKKIIEKKLKKVLKGNKSFVYDSTGTNTDKLLSLIDKTKKAGFYNVLIYVIIDLKTAILRNRLRIRTIPEYILKEKFKLVNYSFNAIKLFVDSYKIIEG
jgi:predicted kinase